ncbi:FecR family protein [Dyadobacter sediminis]|uniref:DUF4974 domain-containing protein n=1 Tax=Dyadobacter sediminis TaxID=1493691 RepID=A0A5R9K9H9_9BACT|nr:FecR domain-containing protein [Dyadobacter sediminis]TLU90714.1 DUF4974 domain-containing protein [Dyadobacter sediminis]GGC10247.1 anti-sigma factor [Dyadobacter sediminis]
MKTPISKYTLFEYLSGRANPLEKQLIEDWISANENTETFYEWLLDYEIQCPQFIPDQEAAVKSLLQRMDSDSYAETNRPRTVMTGCHSSLLLDKINRSWLIAASVTFLLSCCWLFRESLQYKTYQTSFGQITNVYLEDGSRVALNSNSKLKVPRFGFDQDVREVTLEGEAEFSVSHTMDSKRFIVKTSDRFQVEVLGTTFSVFARPRGTKVALKCGSIRLDYSQNEQHKEMMMEPGDMATLDRAGGVQLAKKQDTKTFASWKEQRYVFNSTAVSDIVSMIEENFGQKVKLADAEITNRTITGNFKTKNAYELLRTVSEVLNIRMEQDGPTIILTNK